MRNNITFIGVTLAAIFFAISVIITTGSSMAVWNDDNDKF